MPTFADYSAGIRKFRWGSGTTRPRVLCPHLKHGLFMQNSAHCQYASMIEWLPQSDQEYLAQIEASSMFRIVDFERICRALCNTKQYVLQPTRATLCGY